MQKEQLDLRFHGQDRNFSITARCQQRAEQFEVLKSTLQQWCKKESPAITELAFPGHCNSSCCNRCGDVVKLKAACERFLIRKKEYSAAKKNHTGYDKKPVDVTVDLAKANKLDDKLKTEHADRNAKELAKAQKELAEAEKELVVLQNQPSQNQMLLKVMAEIVALKAIVVAEKSLRFAMEDNVVAAKDELVAIETKLVSKDSYLVAADADCIVEIAGRIAAESCCISNSHVVVKNLLNSLWTADNEAFLLTPETGGGAKCSLIHGPRDPCRSDEAKQLGLSKFNNLCNSSVLDLDHWDVLHKLQALQKDALTPFYKYLQCNFQSASVVDVNAEEYHEKIGVTVKGIMEWNLDESQSTTGFYIPGFVNEETIGVQPILSAILVKMAQILGLTLRTQACSNDSSLYVDFVASNPEEEHLLAILPAMLGFPLEVNSISQKSSMLTGLLLLEAQNQVVRQLAKQAMLWLDFGGVGKDCEVFGLALNMVSVTVIVLKLSGVGTAHVNTSVHQTKQLLLFDNNIGMKPSGETAEMDAGMPLKDTTGKDGMSMGFSVLAQTLMSVHKGVGTSLYGHKNGCKLLMGTTSIELGKPLGSGAFSNVFQFVIKDDSNGMNARDLFIKVPKSYQRKASLGIEAEALAELGANIHIPKLFDTEFPLMTLSIQKQCMMSDLPCLPLRGFIGLPASHQKSWTDAQLQSMCWQVMDALVYANSHFWAHLDVRPSNIIIRSHPGTNCFDVMLIGWGCAHRTTKNLIEFVGCPPYAHDELFDEPDNMHPCLDHDLASLAYTLACLKVGCIPWRECFSDHSNVPNNARKHRLDEVFKILKELKIPEEIKEVLLNAVGPERSKCTYGNALGIVHKHYDNRAMDGPGAGIQNKKLKWEW